MKNNKLIVVATKDEIALIDKYAPREFKTAPIIITGVGGLNVNKSLAFIPKDTKILNIGYAGSIHFPVGKVLRIGRSEIYHKVADYESPVFILPEPNERITCFSTTDFSAPETKVSVQDMELAFIMAMGFEDVISIKVISDHCSYEEYMTYISKSAQ